MENYMGGLKGYWKRRGYDRLDRESGHRRGRRTRIELGRGKRRKFWRIKISPRVNLFSRIRFSPKRILARIRDAYIRMIMGFANSGAVSGGFGCQAVNGFGRQPQLKEYDEKMIVQIYRSLLAQSQLAAAADAGGIAATAAPRVAP